MSVGRQPGKPGWLAMVVNITGGIAMSKIFVDATNNVIIRLSHHFNSSQVTSLIYCT